MILIFPVFESEVPHAEYLGTRNKAIVNSLMIF